MIFAALSANYLQIMARNSDWFIMLYAPILTGQSYYFDIGFSTFIWKPFHCENFLLSILKVCNQKEWQIKLVILWLASDLSERAMLSQDYMFRAATQVSSSIWTALFTGFPSFLQFRGEKNRNLKKQGWLLSLFLLREPNILRKNHVYLCSWGSCTYFRSDII